MTVAGHSLAAHGLFRDRWLTAEPASQPYTNGPNGARLNLVFVTLAHPLYAAELEFRFRLLRAPLGMTRDQVRSPFEAESLHLVALDADVVEGCVLFHPESPTRGRLFQMAVSERVQGAGLGRQLVQTLEAELTRRALLHVHLHARETAVGFYERLGYRTFDAPFVEVGIPHRHMQRTLPAQP